MRVSQSLIEGVAARGGRSVFLRWLRACRAIRPKRPRWPRFSATLAWGPLSRKRISRLTAESFPWWLQLFGTLIGASADAKRHEAGRFCGIAQQQMLESLSLGEIAFAALLGHTPSEGDLFAFQTLVGLLLTNGPGAISAQGAKGAVSGRRPRAARARAIEQGASRLSHPQTGYAARRQWL
jgi:hypothetical protein